MGLFVDSGKKIVFLITTKEWMHKLCNPCVFFLCKKNVLNDPSWNGVKIIVQLNLIFTRVSLFLEESTNLEQVFTCEVNYLNNYT